MLNIINRMHKIYLSACELGIFFSSESIYFGVCLILNYNNLSPTFLLW